MRSCRRWDGRGPGARGILLALGLVHLGGMVVAQGGGDPGMDPSAWSDWPWRFRDPGASVDPGSDWPPTASGQVDDALSPWESPDAGRLPGVAPDGDAGARAPRDQEYHFRGDPGPWAGSRSGGDAGDPYRFRPLSERERARVGQVPGWRSADPGRDGPDRAEGQRPVWPVEPPFRSWP